MEERRTKPVSAVRRIMVAAAIGLVTVLVGSGSLLAQDEEDTSSAEPEVTGQSISDILDAAKKPTPWLELMGDIRLREIFAPNLLLNQEDRHFQRYRFRLGAKVTPIEEIDINTRLVYEPRHFCQPSRELFVEGAGVIDEWTLSEAIIDRLNVTWREFMGLPVTLTVGRQDLIFGNGWLVLDGTPLDGSRTIFFDAIRGTIDMADIDSTLDLVFICNSADSDRLSPACDKNFHNHEQDELGAIAYFTNKSLPKTQLDGYFIYKRDDRVVNALSGSVAPWQQGNTGEIYTVGGRVAGDIDEHWKYRAEFATQWGRKERPVKTHRTDNRDLCAFGFNSRLSYFVRDDWNNNFRISYEYLSGDEGDYRYDSKTTQFDPLWGRWPQFSELYVYPVALDARPGEVTNMHRLGLGWSCNPTDKLEFCADWHILFADENVNNLSAGTTYFGEGCLRGNLVTGLMRYKFNKHMYGHLLAELFFPGDFYHQKTRDEVAGFFRYELTFAW